MRIEPAARRLALTLADADCFAELGWARRAPRIGPAVALRAGRSGAGPEAADPGFSARNDLALQGQGERIAADDAMSKPAGRTIGG